MNDAESVCEWLNISGAYQPSLPSLNYNAATRTRPIMTEARGILTNVAIVSLALIINRCLVEVLAGTGCSKGVLLCHGRAEEMDEIELDLKELEAERIDIDARLLSTAVPLIEEQLTRRGNKDDMNTNIKEIERMLRDEMDAKYLRNAHNKPNPRGKSGCLSSRLDLVREVYSKSDIMINALLKLHDLKRIDVKSSGCSANFTHDLAEVNLMTRDPVGRHSRNETVTFPRVDHMVIQVALRRAVHCFVHYRNALRNLPTFDGYKAMKAYWNRVFEHRIRKERPEETRKAETLFFNDSRKCFEFVEKMPHAIEEGEEYIVRSLFTKKGRKGGNNNRENTDDIRVENDELRDYKRGFDIMVRLCKTFNFLVADVFESLEFDMQLRDLIPDRLLDLVENDYMLNKQRSYHMMCQKLVHDMDQFSDSTLGSGSFQLRQ